MAKSRRKHPGFNTIEETPQGRYFLRHVSELIGEGFRYFPLERLDDNAHVWRVEGRRAWGLLVERPEQQDGEAWKGKWGFRLVAPVEARLVVQATLSAHRWDPWLAFGNGDDSPVRKATRKQRKQWDEQRAASGAERDRVELVVRPRRGQVALVDVPEATLKDLAERYPPAELPPGQTSEDESLRERLQRLLFRIADRVETDRDGDLSIEFGSTRVFVRVIEGDPAPVVNVWAATNLDVPPSPEFFHHVATHADRWLFGHLSAHIDDEDMAFVTFSHRLFGEFLDDAEFVNTVGLIGSTADRIDEEIQSQFGGRIFTHPPEPADVPAGQPPSDEPPTGMYL